MEIKIVQDVQTEPIPLNLVKDYCRIDVDYTAIDEELNLMCAAARGLLEGYLNLSLAPKTLMYQFPGGHLVLPYGPHTRIVSVTDLDGDAVPEDDYRITGLDFKTIDTCCSGLSYFYPINSCYPIIEPIGGFNRSGLNITAEVGYTSENLQSGLKLLILRLVDYMYQNRGSQVSELPEDIQKDSRRYSRNSIL